MRSDVQKELGLSENQVAEIADLLTESEGDEPSGETASWEDVMDASQTARYRELTLQRAGLRALAQDDVAKELGLSDDQVTAIDEAIEAARPPQGEGGFDREAFMKLRDEMNDKIMDVLTDEQEAQWEDMLGEKFEFQQRRGGLTSSPARTPR